MTRYCGRFSAKEIPYFLTALSYFLVEGFAFCFLNPGSRWPLAFGALWAVLLSSLLRLFPRKTARILYGVTYFAACVYVGFETGYYILFGQMMWLSDFRYTSEGFAYMDILLTYPVFWYLGIVALLALGIWIVRRFPKWKGDWWNVLAFAMALVCAFYAFSLPNKVFEKDKDIRYAGSDYGRAQSAEAAYENMFNAHRLYQVCGLYQTLCKDIYTHAIYPLTPKYMAEQVASREEIGDYFENHPQDSSNAMTGLLQGKNVILVLMESMDDWMLGEHTPTLNQLIAEGIEFTKFYTPAFGGIRTFNTEFCINTGSYLSSQGGYAFDYVTNSYQQSLANVLRRNGYSAKTFHYNDPSFYSRGEFSPAMGYEEYVCYADYLSEYDEKTAKQLLYDDLLLFDNPALNAEFFRPGQPTLNFVITRSAHLSYKYNEVLSYWGLKRYPQYRGLTGNEETDCAYLKARLVDDFFAEMLAQLEEKGQLENTVIIGVTDHYTYGYKDTNSLYQLSGVSEALLLEKTPCFIWSKDLQPQKVEKLLSTVDLLPTVLNLLGIQSEHRYLGRDAFSPDYDGQVLFANGSWMYDDTAYDASTKKLYSISGKEHLVTKEVQSQLAEISQDFIRTNNLILKTDYYK